MNPQIKKILYATDLSKNSYYAFFYAVDLANKYNAEIIILHAVEPFRHPYDESGIGIEKRVKESIKREQERNIEEIKKRLQEVCKTIEDQMGSACIALVSKILVPVGYPVEEILKTADDEGCDTIILGTHGKGFLKQTFLGSVAGSVLQRSRKPVFIIPLPSEKTNIDWTKF
ncbi:MAG: universal stress protein [Syntrophaceae bacterium]|nr:universal stress protein [Syntrophaceae bacterium]